MSEINVGTLQTGYLTYKLQDKTERGVQPHAATCPATPYPASQSRWALRLPRVQRLRTRLPDREGSGTATCPEAPDLLAGLWSATFPVALDPASLRGGLRAAMRPTVPCGPRASSMKKSLVCLPVQQNSCSQRTRERSKAPNVRAIMDLQDVRAGTAVHAYKTCGHEATVPLQCSVSVADHSPGTAAGQCGATLLTKRSVVG
jgi:hypothetical protein